MCIRDRTDIGDHGAAPLGHAVDFADLDVVSFAYKALAHEFAREQGPLSANAGNQDIFDAVLYCLIHSASPPLIAPKRQAEAQTPQPTHWVGSITARVFPAVPEGV